LRDVEIGPLRTPIDVLVAAVRAVVPGAIGIVGTLARTIGTIRLFTFARSTRSVGTIARATRAIIFTGTIRPIRTLRSIAVSGTARAVTWTAGAVALVRTSWSIGPSTGATRPITFVRTVGSFASRSTRTVWTLRTIFVAWARSIGARATGSTAVARTRRTIDRGTIGAGFARTDVRLHGARNADEVANVARSGTTAARSTGSRLASARPVIAGLIPSRSIAARRIAAIAWTPARTTATGAGQLRPAGAGAIARARTVAAGPCCVARSTR
jgi:hypothetical protein